MTANAQHQAEIDSKRLMDFLQSNQSVLVAFSGGVDSAVVAAAAYRVRPKNSLAVTAQSPSVSAFQLEMARKVAKQIGISHLIVESNEVQRPEYRRNDARRCYWCKHTLYETLFEIATKQGFEAIASGTNHDDLGDYRPGIEAGRESGVLTPLADLGIGKAAVRAIAQYWELEVWNAPAAPCLASRIAYGVEATPERLHRVEIAESTLRSFGFTDFRVRYHEGDLARIEVAPEEIPRICNDEYRLPLLKILYDSGFRFISVDLQGFRSGSLNELVQISGSVVGN